MIGHIRNLVASNGFAQLIAFVSAPFIARYYGDGVIGGFGLVTAIAGVLIPLYTLRIELSLPSIFITFDAIKTLKSISAFSIVAFFVFTSIFLILSFFIEDDIKSVAVLLSPLFALLGAFNQSLTYWLIRDKNFGSIGVSNILRGIFQNSLIFIPLLFSSSFFYFMLAKVVAGILVVRYLLIKSNLKFSLKDCFNIRRDVIISNRDFATHGVYQSLLNSIGNYLPFFLFAMLFSSSTLGQLTMAFFVVQAPTGLLSQSLRQVLHSALSIKMNEGAVSALNLYKRSVFLLFVTYFLIILIYYIFGEVFIDFYLGDTWALMFVLSKWLLIWYGLTIINPLPSIVYQIARRQDVLSVYDSIYLASRVAFIFIAAFASNQDPVFYVAGLSIIGAIFNVVLIYFGFQYLIGWKRSD